MKNILKRAGLTLLITIVSSAAVIMITKAFTKGDMMVATDSNNLIRVPIGQDGQCLQVSSSATSGVAWVTIATSSGPSKLYISDGSVKAIYHLGDTTDLSGNGYNLTNNNGSTLFKSGKINNIADFCKSK